MYIMITTRCNMKCQHCCYSCTEEGEDMSMEVFKEALAYDEYPSIGGGEPTLHPQFWEFIGVALGSCGGLWLATNGTVTNSALALARLAKKGILSCELSYGDGWHDESMVASHVVAAFYKLDGIRNVSRNPEGIVNQGRAREFLGADDAYKGCPCAEMVVRPNGDVYACGCEDAPKIGNVLTEIDNEEFEYSECWKNQSADWKEKFCTNSVKGREVKR